MCRSHALRLLTRDFDSHRTAGTRSGRVSDSQFNSVYPARSMAGAFRPQQDMMRVDHLPIVTSIAIVTSVHRFIAADRDDRRQPGVTIIADVVAQRYRYQLVIRRSEHRLVD